MGALILSSVIFGLSVLWYVAGGTAKLPRTNSIQQVLFALKQTPEIEKVRLGHETAECVTFFGNTVKKDYQLIIIPQKDGKERTFRVLVSVFSRSIAHVMEKRGYMLKTHKQVWPQSRAVTEQDENSAFLKQLDEQQQEWEGMGHKREVEMLAEDKLLEQETMKAYSRLAEIEGRQIQRKFDKVMQQLKRLREMMLRKEKQKQPPMVGICRTSAIS